MAEDASKTPLVSVVVPTRNRKIAVARCVESILGSNNARLEIIVVDDASSDGTFDHLSKLFPNITLLRNEKNRLVSYSRNIGCKRAKGDLIFLIDDDNVVHSDAIAELVKAVTNNSQVGIAGPIMYYLGAPREVWCSGVSRNYWTSTTRFSTTKPEDSTYCYSTEDIPNSFMVRKKVFDDIGYFDQVVYAQHLEESDFCRRASRKGYSVVMVPKATIWHDVPVRNWPYRSTRNLHMHSSTRAYYVARNRIMFMRKYAGPWRFVVFTVVFLPAISLAHLMIILNEGGIGGQRGAFASCYVRGLIDGFNPKIHGS